MEDIENKSVLDDLKKIEEQKKKKLLVKSLNKLKEKAKQVLTIKEETNAILNNLGLSTKEQKQIIDWINSLPDVQLSDDDKIDIEVEIKDEMNENRKQIDKTTESIFDKMTYTVAGNTNGIYLTGTATGNGYNTGSKLTTTGYNLNDTSVTTSIGGLAYKQGQFEIN